MADYDPYDPTIVPPRADDEDGRVLDTAVARRAHILATYNLGDFASSNTVVVAAGRAHVFRSAQHTVCIM